MTPDGWSVESLGSLARIERGKFSARPRNDPRYFGGSVPFIQTGDVKSDNGFVSTYSSLLNEAGVSVSRVFPPNTLFMTIAANIGDVAVAPFECACPDSLVALHPRPGVNKRWLYYALAASKRQLESIATLNAQLNINLEKLNPFELLVPPTGEQARIGQRLDRVSAAVGALSGLIAKKRDVLRAETEVLLGASRRLPGFQGEWTETECGALFGMRKGSVVPLGQSGGHYPIIAGGKRPAGYTERFNRSGPSVTVAASGSAGYVSYHPGPIWASDSSTIEPGEGYDLGFVYWSLLAKQAELYRAQRGGGQPHVYPRDVYDIVIKIPPTVDEQRAIGETLHRAESEIHALERRLRKLRDVRRGMMQSLLSGGVRLTEELV